jgi:hypothetical protein
MLRNVCRAFPAVVVACGLTAWLSGCGSRTPAPDPDDEKSSVVAVADPSARLRPAKKVRLKRTTHRQRTDRVAARPHKTERTAAAPAAGGKKTAPAPGQKPAAVAEGPAPPPDRAATMVGNLLRPSEAAFAPRSGRSPALAGPRALEQPEVPPPSYGGDVLRLPTAAVTKPLRPRHLADEMPLARVRGDYRLPAPVDLPVAALARQPAPDVEKPPPLPILAGPQPDRAALADPTAQASLEAALAGQAPLRTTPAPFDRPDVPDPIEGRHTVRLAEAPAEAPLPPQVLPRTPAKSLPVTGK